METQQIMSSHKAYEKLYEYYYDGSGYVEVDFYNKDRKFQATCHNGKLEISEFVQEEEISETEHSILLQKEWTSGMEADKEEDLKSADAWERTKEALMDYRRFLN